MIIECSHCSAKYQYDEARFDGKISKKIRCAKCQQVFEIRNPSPPPRPEPPRFSEPVAAPKPAPPPVPPPPPVVNHALDETISPRRGQPDPGAMQESLDETPMTTDQTPPDMRLPVGIRLSLAVLTGPDAAAVYRIDKARMIIGRSNADIQLNDTEVSRAHAAIEVRDTQYLLEDLGSTNGTIVDGEKITEWIELQNHTEFQVGGTTLMLIVTDES